MNSGSWPLSLVSSVINQAVSAQDQRASHYPHKITPCAMGSSGNRAVDRSRYTGLAAVAMLLGKAEVIHSRRRWRTKAIGEAVLLAARLVQPTPPRA